MKARKRLTEKQKSELCIRCGRCCMAMTFYGGEVDEESLDEIRWMELHGLRIDYVEKRCGTRRKKEYYFTIDRRCDALREEDGRYTCGVYETRPEMCRDYEGDMKGPFGVKECLWRLDPGSPELIRILGPERKSGS